MPNVPHLINVCWIDIPEAEIYEQLYTLGLTTWENKTLSVAGYPRHYLFGGPYAYPYSLPPEVIGRLSKRLNEAKYMTWYREYNLQAIAYFEEHNQALNQAQEYWAQVGNGELPSPEIIPVDGLSVGDEYIAIVGLFHLTGAENGNNHHLYIDLIDMNGERIYDHYPPLSLYYGWDGMTAEQQSNVSPVRIDKPPNEPGANIGISWGQVIYGFHINNMAVDRFRGVHIRYEDDREGNDRGHHSHYIVLQKRVFQSDMPPEPEPPEPPQLESVGSVDLLLDKEFLSSLPVDGQGRIRLIVPIYR